LDFAAGIDTSAWPACARKVAQRQLIEPKEEEKIKTQLPKLTAIDDSVSQAVRQQYEENPYPRWRRRSNAGQAQSIHALMRQRFPHQDFAAESPDVPEILIAGCGTGSDAVQVVNTFKNAKVLAVDMSSSSLAYAKRATREFGVDNIEFGQADILELASLNRKFDIVVCSGVLHHMKNPMAGWRVLLQLLRPRGYMNIGLYSRRARTEVAALRELIAKAGYAATPEGIRRFRADVMRGDGAIAVGDLARSPDFYSISACRDLLFHVQEHVFSPLDIQSCLDELGLQFLGFDLPNPEARNRYLERFPDNPACDSLANWDAVEQDHPQIFAGMYQFWTRKS
jgi:2-polyprenyl-3-methyl-5-hydroxy-6-metoxy-1,4-benzoquinol methylase